MPVQGRELSISSAGNPSQNSGPDLVPIYRISFLTLLREFLREFDVVATWTGSSSSPIDHLLRRPISLVDRGQPSRSEVSTSTQYSDKPSNQVSENSPSGSRPDTEGIDVVSAVSRQGHVAAMVFRPRMVHLSSPMNLTRNSCRDGIDSWWIRSKLKD